jgi:hypothetical protein
MRRVGSAYFQRISLLVGRKHGRMLWRIPVEADHVRGLGFEVWITRARVHTVCTWL